MFLRFPRYCLFLLLFLPLIACDNDKATVTGPTALTSTMTNGPVVGFEPAALRPEFLPANSCVRRSPFGTRIIIVIGPGGGVFVRSLRFRFTDRFGVTALPRVTPIIGPSPLTVPVSTIAPFSPIPVPGGATLPSTGPIPIPGSAPINGLQIPSGTLRTLPFFLSFDCGVLSEGVVHVTVDTATPNGQMETSELRARVGL
jgi:hypothetical protein